MTITKSEVDMIRDALEREGVPDGNGGVVVPEDFFARLNRALNPPRPNILDQLVEGDE